MFEFVGPAMCLDYERPIIFSQRRLSLAGSWSHDARDMTDEDRTVVSIQFR